MLVTQNVDDFHAQAIRESTILTKVKAVDVEGELPLPRVEALAFTPMVYEIHGNCNYMHCSRED
jgi:NAD-dependent SIR2 family protein deacetylase